MKKKSLIGIDIGTTNIKIVSFDLNGKIIHSEKKKTPLLEFKHQDEKCEFKAEKIWGLTVSLLKKVIINTKKSHKITAISCASFAESGIPIDKNGKVIANSLIWYDKRTKTEEIFLKKKFKNYPLSKVSGMRLDYIAGLCKILWFKNNQPLKYKKMHKWLNVADYIYFKLSGKIATDLSLAGRTLILDIKKKSWNKAILNKLQINPNILPPIVENGKNLGPILEKVKKLIKLENDCSIAVGGHDHVMGAISSGIFNNNFIQDSMGTSESIIFNTPSIITNNKLIEFGYEQCLININKPLYYLQAGLNTSSKAIDLFLKKFNFKFNNNIKKLLIKKYKSNSNYKIFFPPDLLNEKLKNNITFNNSNNKVDKISLLLALMEGIVFEVKKIVLNLISLSPKKNRKIICTGGGTNNDILMKIKSNVFGKKIYVIKNYESVCLGVAILAGISIGEHKNLNDAFRKINNQIKIYSPLKDKIYFYNKKYLSYLRHKTKI